MKKADLLISVMFVIVLTATITFGVAARDNIQPGSPVINAVDKNGSTNLKDGDIITDVEPEIESLMNFPTLDSQKEMTTGAASLSESKISTNDDKKTIDKNAEKKVEISDKSKSKSKVISGSF